MKLLLLFLFAQTARATSFDAPVDYWPKAKAEQQANPWQPYLDPNNIKFWQEGDYTPPVPLILAMQNPTNGNIEKFLTYLNRRSFMHGRFQKALSRYKYRQIKAVTIAYDPACASCKSLRRALSQSDFEAQKITWVDVSQGSATVEAVPTIWVETFSGTKKRYDHWGEFLEEVL